MRSHGVIIVDHGSRRVESNRMLEEVARLFAERFRDEHPIVEPAHMELCEPSIETAYRRCVERGAGRIVCLPFFLSYGKHWTRDIPSLLSQAASLFPGTIYQLVEPLGIDELMLELLAKRLRESRQPFYGSDASDPRLRGIPPTERRELCTSCPFRVAADGTIIDTRRSTQVPTRGDRS